MKERQVVILKDGRKYFAKAIFPSGRVRVWGELVAYKGLDTKHEEDKLFSREEVASIELEDKSSNMVAEMFEQYKKCLAGKGKKMVQVSKTKYVIQ